MPLSVATDRTKETTMNRIFKTAIMAVAIGATTLATLPAANARDWRWRHHGHHSSHNGDAVIAGVAGLAAGASRVSARAGDPLHDHCAAGPNS